MKPREIKLPPQHAQGQTRTCRFAEIWRVRKTAVCVLLFLAASTLLRAQTPQSFSADMSSALGNGQKMTGKYYFSAPKMRVDIYSMPQTGSNSPFGGQMSWIIDGTQTSYMLMPQQQMYMEFPSNMDRDEGMRQLSNISTGGTPCTARADLTCKKVGTEMVGGRVCDKWETVDKKSRRDTVWIDQKLHFPIKIQTQNGNTTEFTNIKEGPLDASLFKVPDGYRKFDPGTMMKQTH